MSFHLCERKMLCTVNTSQKRIMLICATEKEILMTNTSKGGVDGGVCAVGSAVIFLELLMKGLCVHMLTESSCSCCFDTLRQVPNCSPGAFLFSTHLSLTLFLGWIMCSWFGDTLVWVSWIPWIGLEFLTYIKLHFLNYRFGSIQVILIWIGICSFQN